MSLDLRPGALDHILKTVEDIENTALKLTLQDR